MWAENDPAPVWSDLEAGYIGSAVEWLATITRLAVAHDLCLLMK